MMLCSNLFSESEGYQPQGSHLKLIKGKKKIGQYTYFMYHMCSKQTKKLVSVLYFDTCLIFQLLYWFCYANVMSYGLSI